MPYVCAKNNLVINRSNTEVYVIAAQIMVMILSSLLCDWNGSPHIAALILDNSSNHVSNFHLVLNRILPIASAKVQFASMQFPVKVTSVLLEH